MPAKEFSIEQRGVGMLKLAEEIIDDAERAAQRGASLEGALAVLRGLDIDNFGLLLLGMPDPRWPALSVLLPAASTEDMDRHLTGDTGVSLLLKSTRFMRALEADFLRYTGRSLLGVRVLDYGYGYGRLTRLMLKYTDPVSIYGCDVAQRSLDWASQLRLPGQYALIDEAPTSLPFAPGGFDLIYAFSVFTHLSERVTQAAMNVLINALKPNGLLVVTIRDVMFWRISDKTTPEEAAALIAAHQATGFAFFPFLPYAHDFGDTSISLNWLQQHFPQLEVLGYDWGIGDANQIVIYLRPGWRFPQHGGLR